MALELTMDGVTLDAVIKIIVIDLVLSGDNAVVIAMAVKSLPPQIARRAAIIGAAGAVLLRVLFAALAAVLLAVPYLQAIGGALLFWIAYKLLVQKDEEMHHAGDVQGFWQAVRIIILADVVMSLDNILAVGGAAHGNLALLLFGLVLSIPIVLFGSQLLTGLMHRWPFLAYLGAGVLAWTAGEMLLHDAKVGPLVTGLGVAGLDKILIAGGTAAVLLAGYLVSRKKAPQPEAQP